MSETTPTLPAFERVTWPVRTARLTIRPVTLEDFARLYEIRSLPGVTHWLTGSPASLEEYVERYGTPERLTTTLVSEADDGIVGDLFLALDTPYSQAEVRAQAERAGGVVGWVVDPTYSGQGYATEGAAELLRICFESLGLHRVVAGAFAGNAASVRVMEKIGMRIESRGVRASLHRDLGWVDHVEAAILAEEWRARNGVDRP
ncbi:MAG TPA: GNAT family N-acetyltransferase [Nocardioides sp.]|jgi:RimJ/RimL family protein N-acetyltransferase|nr:GNAT family N-acetyltransferase [Nocardioides sp.]